MTHELGAQKAKWRGYGLVRDADGSPVIDDPENLHPEIKKLLTDEEYFKIYNEQRK